MPELPEVETIVQALDKGGRGAPPVTGQVIHTVRLFWLRSLATPGVEQFEHRLPGQQIKSINRRGKFIHLTLSQDHLLIHLRMSGDLRHEPNSDETGIERPPADHDRVLLIFENDWRLVFNDPRKFGRVWLVQDPIEVLADLGPEPLDGSLNADKFSRMLMSRHRQLKPLLMDQKFLAGMGNIYTDESLHMAGLHPRTIASDLTAGQTARLLEAIRKVLKAGIRTSGASIDWVYRGGDFQNHFRVYQRTGKPCPVCGSPVERILVGQRGTHFCATCQPQPIARN